MARALHRYKLVRARLAEARKLVAAPREVIYHRWDLRLRQIATLMEAGEPLDPDGEV